MSDSSVVSRSKQILNELIDIIKNFPDDQLFELLGTGLLDSLLKAILDPDEKNNYPNLDKFLLAKKFRATLLAGVRNAISQNYAFLGKTPEGNDVYISPNYFQWFDDGVLFLQSDKPFEGFLGLYRQDGTLSYAVAARDARPGERLGPEYFEFVDEAEFIKRSEFASKIQIADLDRPIHELEMLLNNHDNDESHYQEWLIQYPWIFGAAYKEVQRHTKLDDGNIPDFTGIRVHDSYRDIIEIKPPFTSMFRSDGRFTANFNDALDQAERYLHFTEKNSDYLLRKGLRFENSKCYLILGFNLTEKQLEEFRRKERMNPKINLRTYNDLLAIAKNTIVLLQNLKSQAAVDKDQEPTSDI